LDSRTWQRLSRRYSVARTLVELQKDKRGIDYIESRAAQIEAVTPAQIKAAAERLLSAEPAVLVIGPAENAAPAPEADEKPESDG